MINVKFSTPSSVTPAIRITPGCKGIVGNCKFHINEDVERADWWVVVEGPSKKESAICPKENTILITQETDVVKDYQQKYVNQFNWVVTSHRTMKHPHKILTQQGHSSFLFMRRKRPDQSVEEYQNQFKTYDELKAMKPADIPKSKLFSTVVSHKVRSEGAIARNKFVQKLKEHFVDRLDTYSNKPGVFGPDTKVAGFKWDAVAPYQYCIGIENSYAPHWWTNHLFDIFIAGTYPIYYGHPSIFEYFPKNSLTLIDINDVPGSIATIEKVISENYFEKYQKEIWEARKLALEKYNIFQTVADVIASLPSSTNAKRITIRPEEFPFIKFKNRLVKEVNRVPVVRDIAKRLYRTYRTWRYREKFDNK